MENKRSTYLTQVYYGLSLKLVKMIMVNVDGAIIIAMNGKSKTAARPDGEQGRSSTKLTCKHSDKYLPEWAVLK